MSFPAADPDRLRRRGFRLEYATMTWMVAEATIAITKDVYRHLVEGTSGRPPS